MAAYEIVVTRTGKLGRLKFEADGVTVDTDCWWDPEVVIDANPDGYVGWATMMATKKRQAIWLGKGVKYNKGKGTSDAIFIHEGNNAAWSDGCIVAHKAEVLKIWNAIVPQKTSNVLVKVLDVIA
jgi:hypothetical protein